MRKCGRDLVWMMKGEVGSRGLFHVDVQLGCDETTSSFAPLVN